MNLLPPPVFSVVVVWSNTSTAESHSACLGLFLITFHIQWEKPCCTVTTLNSTQLHFYQCASKMCTVNCRQCIYINIFVLCNKQMSFIVLFQNIEHWLSLRLSPAECPAHMERERERELKWTPRPPTNRGCRRWSDFEIVKQTLQTIWRILLKRV